MMNAADQFGRGIAFPPRVGPDGQWAWSEGPENIREAIRIILQTEAGERLMLRPFGAGLERFLFASNTTATRRLIQERVENALSLWEPRINLRNVSVTADANDARRVVITIEYELIASGTGEQLALAVNLGS